MANEELVKKIREGTWKNPELRGADLSLSLLQRANLSDADLENADLRGADLRESDLKNAYLRNADLTAANLSGANLFAANLETADIKGASMIEADLERANLDGADMEKTNLQHANLQHAKLTGANLEFSDLRMADLRNTDMEFAYLLETNLQNAKVNQGTNEIMLPEEYHIVEGLVLLISEQNHDDIYVIDIDTAPPPPALEVNPEDRILSSSHKSLNNSAKAIQSESLQKLLVLRRNLDSLHGKDEKLDGIPNTEPAPLTKGELTILMRAVDAAISLHKVPEFPSNLTGALTELMLFLKASAERLQNLYDEEAEALGKSKLLKFAGLIGALTLAWQTLQAFIGALG